ncbi:MAG: hypothetical protein OXE83_16050 [Gammaproteobacteria bacterium]|nr:hypothetical protein [Gammaproteobacteria bacterium]
MRQASAVGALLAACLPGLAGAVDVQARAKLFGTAQALPSHDLQRRLDRTPAYDGSADFRLMLRHTVGSVTILADHALTLVSGDSHGLLQALQPILDQSPAGDGRRMVNLTWDIESGARHRSWGRVDRLAVQHRLKDWSLTLGRQAVSWGNGMVFAPMDLFNPFAPTTVDRDYKAGDDLFLAERLLANGADLQLLAVARRDERGRRTGQAASTALKWHGFVGRLEFDLLAAKHYRDQVFGGGFRWPLGVALLRSDLVATRLRDGGWRLSGLLNADVSLTVAGRNAYLFAEYFHNGFGVAKLPPMAEPLPSPLAQRLSRGEVFNPMRDYLAVGGNLEWHPLVNQALTLIGNLNDGSVLLQTSVTHERGDHQRLQLGIVTPIGQSGKEFGGIPVFGDRATSGGGQTLFMRWVYYF